MSGLDGILRRKKGLGVSSGQNSQERGEIDGWDRDGDGMKDATRSIDGLRPAPKRGRKYMDFRPFRAEEVEIEIETSQPASRGVTSRRDFEALTGFEEEEELPEMDFGALVEFGEDDNGNKNQEKAESILTNNDKCDIIEGYDVASQTVELINPEVAEVFTEEPKSLVEVEEERKVNLRRSPMMRQGKVRDLEMKTTPGSVEMEWQRVQRQKLEEKRRADAARRAEEERILREREEAARRMQMEKMLKMRQQQELAMMAEKERAEALERERAQAIALQEERRRRIEMAKRPQFINTAVPKRPLSGGRATAEPVAKSKVNEDYSSNITKERQGMEVRQKASGMGTIIVPVVKNEGKKSILAIIVTVLAGAIVGVLAYFLLLAR